ncbi:PWWP domain-containing protein 2A [Cololabis saira]|uniref:PWWP domain-containing protein 2A n=1 Tax=Cololabis saira TaxID=129043 RepID=UPI002AD35C2A|nr:PWWP domain-containing protein 2A [Cololabis saira]
MAAVAADPGAAAVPTTTTSPATELDVGIEPGSRTEPGRGPGGPQDSLLSAERAEDGGDSEARHVGPGPGPAGGGGTEPPPERFSPGLSPTDPYRSIPPDPQPHAVFLHSFPAPPGPGAEAGLSLAEPAEPARCEPGDRDRDPGRGYTALLQDGAADRPEPGAVPGRFCSQQDRRAEPVLLDLSPGSEVRVCLDHVIDDALVVSFRRGDQVFSGVLMDVSKRFGPYGIPITVFPRRDDHSQPPVPLHQVTSDNFPSIKQEENTATPPSPPPPQPWTSKPPPLFQEGAPYPPPLFIRDTYNQALPQPLPRKIKRPKRRYRCEEPTSIMNAIKLRPRQVLCDKCKGVVTSGGHREARRVELRSEEASRRRRPPEGPISSEVKRLRSDDKGGRAERRTSSEIHVSSSSSSSSRRVLRGVASSSSASSSSSSQMHLKLNSKKVLAKGSVIERSKARQVLKKLVRSSQPVVQPKDQDQNRPGDQEQDRTKAVTRAAALQNHNQKVHFTRRLQRLSGAAFGAGGHATLPPRMRLKPQRYRTDDSQAPPSPAPSKQNARLSPPPKAPISPASEQTATPPHSVTAPPPTPPSLSEFSIATEAQEAPAPVEEGVGHRQEVYPPPPSFSSIDSSYSESSSTETFDLPPPGDAPSSSSPPTPDPLLPPTSLAPRCPPTLSPAPPRAESEDEEGSDLKRRSKSSSSSSVFSKTVSKCLLPDGRTVCVGDIVWAKIYGFPWWPARVLGITVSRRGDTGLAVRQEARVSWFGSPTTSFLPLSQLSPFLETFQLRFDKKRKGPYRRAIAEAASAAKQLTPEVRALLTQFET